MSKMDRGTPGLTLDQAVRELHVLVEDAESFIASELEDNWERAERYFDGMTDLEEFDGRSKVVKTEVRDAVRNTMPSIMRILFQGRKIVEYAPTSVQHAMWADQQGIYVRELFDQCGGYETAQTSIEEALKLKIGPQKVYWQENPRKTYQKYTNLQESYANALLDNEDFELEEATKDEERNLWTVTGWMHHPHGKIVYEAVPNYEFFISRNSPSIEHAIQHGVHGHARIVTVDEAMDMGLEYDDWISLNDDDPETTDHTSSSTARRGYHKDSPNDPSSVDVLRHEFLLTEAYFTCDLKDEGRPQLYRFFLGGSNHVLIDYEEVEDSPYAVIVPIPIPHTMYGFSYYDLLHMEQDTLTSLTRGAVDNVHAANGAKIGADPRLTDFDDLMNPALNAPVKKKPQENWSVIQIPYTGQGNLQLMQYLDMDTQSKVGVTKAAQGLDPDALQSTDKDAVLNTIMTSQGQIELLVRNIVQRGLIRVFKLMLNLAMRHMQGAQLTNIKGTYVPVPLDVFDADALAKPVVGIGTGSPEQKLQAYAWAYQQQDRYMEKYGPNNPFTSYSQMYNTIEDILETQGIHNTQRHFNVVTPQIEQQWARKQAEINAKMQEEAKANQPMDPSLAFLKKAELDSLDKRAQISADYNKHMDRLRFDTEKQLDDSDIRRDDQVQTRIIELAKINQQDQNQAIKGEQNANNSDKRSAGGEKSS